MKTALTSVKYGALTASFVVVSLAAVALAVIYSDFNGVIQLQLKMDKNSGQVLIDRRPSQ